MARRPPRILLSAGEPSGDLHGAALAAALRKARPELAIEALGGPRLAAEGVDVRYPMERYTALGFAEVVRKLPAHWLLLRRLERELRSGRYDLVIPIDYPGFNLRLAEAARRHGVPVLYYIAPKFWASGAGRVPRLARAVNRLAVVLPFEQEFFARRGVPADYVGHPLLDQGPSPAREAARAILAVAPGERLLALFPGSRPQEVARLWPPFRDAARLLLTSQHCHRVVIAETGGGSYPAAAGFVRRKDDSATILAAADVALIKSGTATLEAALAAVPMVVAYRLHWLSARIVRRLLTVPWISLPNLIAGTQLVPELVQAESSPKRLAAALAPLFEGKSTEVARQQEGFALIRQRLGGAGASAQVARLALALLP